MRLTRRQLQKVIRESILLRESAFEFPQTTTDQDVKVLNDMWRTAEGGYKIIAQGKRGSVYTGIGNREGLYGYATQLAREKWVRGKKTLIRKMKGLEVGDVIFEKDGRQLHRLGKWTQGLVDLMAVIRTPEDVQNVFNSYWG